MVIEWNFNGLLCVSFRPTNEDEMCNFYVMYYSNTEPLENKYCFTSGPPVYRWSTDSTLDNIPEIESTRL